MGHRWYLILLVCGFSALGAEKPHTDDSERTISSCVFRFCSTSIKRNTDIMLPFVLSAVEGQAIAHHAGCRISPANTEKICTNWPFYPTFTGISPPFRL